MGSGRVWWGMVGQVGWGIVGSGRVGWDEVGYSFTVAINQMVDSIVVTVDYIQMKIVDGNSFAYLSMQQTQNRLDL